MKTAKDLRIPFTWADRRPIVLDRFFYIPALYDKHEELGPIDWRDWFGNDHPVYIEYCSGNGQWIGERALQNPHLNWVAVEKRFDRARKIWLKLHRENIPNLFVVCGEAQVFTRYYPPKGSVFHFFVNFPDPWPKHRHAKHRLIQKQFLEEAARIVVPNGKATFVTDDWPYASQMLAELQNCPPWNPLLPAPHYTKDWSDYGSSFFAELWKEKGRSFHFIPFEKAT